MAFQPFLFLNAVYRKLVRVVKFIIVYLLPIYKEVVAIIKEVKQTDLKDDAARKAVFQKITDYLQNKGIATKYPDSIINTIIEMVYLAIKLKFA